MKVNITTYSQTMGQNESSSKRQVPTKQTKYLERALISNTATHLKTLRKEEDIPETSRQDEIIKPWAEINKTETNKQYKEPMKQQLFLEYIILKYVYDCLL